MIDNAGPVEFIRLHIHKRLHISSMKTLAYLLYDLLSDLVKIAGAAIH